MGAEITAFSPEQGTSRSVPSEADAAVLRAVASGDLRGALVLCSQGHAAAIGRLCMALTGSQSEAEDLLQETLIDAHHGLGGFRAEGSLRSWLLGIARRKCARHLERRLRRESKLRLIHDSDRHPATDELMAARERAERARHALEAIRPSEREALLLRYDGELSFREVGELCGIDEAAARKRVSRAIARLRDALGDEPVRSRP